MLTIQIHDEELERQLQNIAEQEHRSVEDVLKTLLAQYKTPNRKEDALEQIRRKAYAKARQYWESVGDTAKSMLSDADLDSQFGRFDEEGIPRLKSELKSLEPPIGSLAYVAKVIREMGGIHGTGSLDAAQTDEILNSEFADYLLKRMRDNDASE